MQRIKRSSLVILNEATLGGRNEEFLSATGWAKIREILRFALKYRILDSSRSYRVARILFSVRMHIGFNTALLTPGLTHITTTDILEHNRFNVPQ